MNEPVSEEQLDELINGTGYDFLHQKLAGEVRAARAREAEAYSAGFEQCRRRAVAAEAEVERLRQRMDKALELHQPVLASRTAGTTFAVICSCGKRDCPVRAALVGPPVDVVGVTGFTRETIRKISKETNNDS